MINNIDKAIQATKIEEKKSKYYKLKGEYDTLPARIKKAEMDYYTEGGCNLNDIGDTKRCGLEYYLEIKREERQKILESFTNYRKQKDEDAEELSSVGLFDTIGLNKLFNKTIEGMTYDNDTCDWTKDWPNEDEIFQDNDRTSHITSYKYNEELEILIDKLNSIKKMAGHTSKLRKNDTKMSDIVANGNMNLDKEKRERIRKGKIDYRNAIFYNKMTNEYKTAIRILEIIYWIVFTVLIILFIYKKQYEVDRMAFIVILTFAIIPFVLLKPMVEFIMLNVKRYHFIDTLYFTIAVGTVALTSVLYLMTSQ
tara:strand:+ start:4621 stop:5550 length:930 start_codon:yes stop_codon:yes gene_type:complete